MKKIKFLYIIFLFLTQTGYSQEETLGHFEIWITNNTSDFLYVKFYPISAVYNGFQRYTDLARYRHSEALGTGQTHIVDFLNGTRVIKDINNNYHKQIDTILHPGDVAMLNFEMEATENGLYASYGNGTYMFYFKGYNDQNSEEIHYEDSLIYIQDGGVCPDVKFEYVPDRSVYNYEGPSTPGMIFRSARWRNNTSGGGWGDDKSTTLLPNKRFKVWHPYPWIDTTPETDGYRLKWLSSYLTNQFFNNGNDFVNDHILPVDARRDCIYDGINQNHSFADRRQGNIYLNTKISQNSIGSEIVKTPIGTSRQDYPTEINILRNFDTTRYSSQCSCYVIDQPELKISARLIIPYDNINFPGNSNAYTIINNYAKLTLESNLSKIDIGNTNHLYLYNGSVTTLGAGTQLLLNSGAKFCNYGGVIQGPGYTTINRLVRCGPSPQDFLIKDSSKIVLADSALWELDSNSIITLEGDSTILDINKFSTIKFGKNSKIIVRNGASLIADSATFTFLDNSSDLWSGIFLEDAGNLTSIKNCTFNTAKTAITIKDTGSVHSYCEILNNTFNIPSGGSYGIYAKNVDAPLIKNNKFNILDSKSDAIGCYIKDIAQSDTTYLVIPDSTTIQFNAKASSLYLNQFTKIKMGAGSKLIFDSAKTFIANNLKFTALDSTKPWQGIKFIDMDTVIMNRCEVKGVKIDSSYNNGYSLVFFNSKNTNIDSCTIGDTTNTAGGILLYFQNNTFYYPNVNISNNTISTKSLIYNGINVAAYSSFMSSVNIERNTITNRNSTGGGSGIFTYGIQSSKLKNNTINNFNKGIETWYSSFDIFQNEVNTITGYDARGITGVGSAFNMGVMGGYWIGGGNKLNTQSGYCLHLDASSFNIDGGYNVFNITDNTYGYHLRGYFPTTPTSDSTVYARENCFEVGGLPVSSEYDIKKYLIWANASPVDLIDFSDPSCGESQGLCSYYVIENGDTKDTIWLSCDEGSGGLGGGTNGISNIQELSMKQIYEGMNVNMRKKEFAAAESKCKAMIENYSDSLKSLEVVDKLYFATLVQDENGNKISALKSYFESYIQNHPENTLMIQKMFFYIQKCKASLGQYSSALQGFETIMNQFPTSYEGLAAKWDYMATSLLSGSLGSGGNENENTFKVLTQKQAYEKLVQLVEDPKDIYDKTKFSEKDRKVIAKNIVTAFEEQKNNADKKLIDLTKKVVKNKASDNEVRDYNVMTKLKEIVRVKKVNSIQEQISAVQEDKIKMDEAEKFVAGKNIKDNVIPYDYKLYQNYPNPFNPTTKINYEIKAAGFVSLKIYDLLGREIAELVNQRQDAGRYFINFDASKYMLASGIYFYRIKAGDFVDTKRMVLVK